MSANAAQQAQVLVIGAGPAGLVAAIVLARNGVGVLVAEKRPAISTLPRALVISTRSMEILRGWGLEPAVRAGAADVEPCGWVTRTLASGEGVEIPLGYPTAAQAAAVSPTRPAWAPQDHLEPLLLDLLRRHPSARVRFDAELIDLAQDDRAVTAVLADRASGRTGSVRARFVIGADGAHSTVRALLGIRMVGPDDLGEFHRVQFEAPLTGLLGPHRYGLNVITHPDAACVIAPRGPGDLWSFNREWRPGQDRVVDAAEHRIAHLIATAVGVSDLRPRIERVNAFSFAAQLADRYRERRGFVVGDAAHRVTPRGGTGMNTAIHDAYDLGWKLAWVLRGWAGPGLLDSYETERRPVGKHNVQRSGDPGGARRTADEALPHDLNGRLAHRWLDHPEDAVSTLDLVGDGLTVLAAHDRPGWVAAVARLGVRAPLVVHAVGPSVAAAVGIAPEGAVVLRPDGRLAATWAEPTVPPTVQLAGLASP